MKYELDILPSAFKEIKRLPGNMRQRVRKAIDDLTTNPYPARSVQLNLNLSIGEPRRLRVEQWRIIYAVIDNEVKVVAVLAIRRRPPYDYQDLEAFFSIVDY